MNRSIAIALALTGAAAITVVSAPSAFAADPAQGTVDSLHGGLLALMKSGGTQASRTRAIAPVIDRTFDLPLMARLSVGPAWTTIPAPQQASLIQAFRNLTVAQYAKNFNSYAGETFAAVGVETRGGDKLVRTTLNAGRTRETLNYRLRQSGGQWKIIDVYYRNAISQLATRRADFDRVMKTGGATALIGHLNRLTARAG
ncbi:MAG: ABC transporter substrate-binding protein [Novosphingobium sp.]